MTVENTDPAVPWLTNYLETLLMQAWYPSTVASLAYRFRRMLGGWGERTGAPAGWLDFALHDFGFRGVSSVESAGLGGMGHLVFFNGTDTFEAVEDALDLYGEPMAGYSVPAAEHSTMTSWGRDGEADAYRNMLEQFPSGIVAVVSDSYDIAEACRIWGTVLKAEVLARAGTLVVRPDSGVPWESVLGVLNILWSHFGGTVNAAGYRVLDAHVRVIQGDGVNLESADRVMRTIVEAGFAAENVTFGMGGALLQKLNRDTYDFAFKCSHAVVDGVGRDVYKDPKGMHAKASKRGRLKLTPEFVTVPEDAPGEDVLRDVFLDGDLVVDDSFAAIRRRARPAL
jgi:nicotinamide phosphoribosyltransferase